MILPLSNHSLQSPGNVYLRVYEVNLEQCKFMCMAYSSCRLIFFSSLKLLILKNFPFAFFRTISYKSSGYDNCYISVQDSLSIVSYQSPDSSYFFNKCKKIIFFSIVYFVFIFIPKKEK